MIFRCKSCQGTVWLQATTNTSLVSCSQCRQRYQIDAGRRRKLARGGLSGQARKLAKQQGLDLPGSYSVLLGIMSAEEVRELGCAGSVACTTGPVRASGYRSGAVDYDPAFRPAVLAGNLTAKQALERGQRDIYAAFVANRHRLPREVAYRVADNRISLLEAVRRFRKQPGGAVRLTPPALGSGTATRTAALFSVPLLAIAFLMVLGARPATVMPESHSSTIGAARVETNDRGRVVRVEGPSPRSVLNAFCETGSSGQELEPLQVAAHVSRGARARLGLILDRSEPSTLLAITILEDRDANFWFSGDGREPLVASVAPDGAERAVMRGRSVALAPATPIFGATMRGGFGFVPQRSK